MTGEPVPVTVRIPPLEFDLEAAFRFPRTAPTHFELDLAAGLLRESGVEFAYDDELVKLAVASESSAFTALDLCSTAAFGVESLRPTGRERERSGVSGPTAT